MGFLTKPLFMLTEDRQKSTVVMATKAAKQSISNSFDSSRRGLKIHLAVIAPVSEAWTVSWGTFNCGAETKHHQPKRAGTTQLVCSALTTHLNMCKSNWIISTKIFETTTYTSVSKSPLSNFQLPCHNSFEKKHISSPWERYQGTTTVESSCIHLGHT